MRNAVDHAVDLPVEQSVVERGEHAVGCPGAVLVGRMQRYRLVERILALPDGGECRGEVDGGQVLACEEVGRVPRFTGAAP